MSPSCCHRPSTKKPWVATGAIVISAMFWIPQTHNRSAHYKTSGKWRSGTKNMTAETAEEEPRATPRKPFTIGPTAMDWFPTISALGQQLRKKEISSLELTRECLGRIEKF